MHTPGPQVPLFLHVNLQLTLYIFPECHTANSEGPDRAQCWDPA